uniref:Ig-like domain-containing protein n=1 Tax=Scleropages formosus TaxID=113540 RepID=A0A8C9RDV1_SCLFO
LLWSLLSLLSNLLIGVRGQRLVTQEPSVLNVNKGETAILDCKKPQDDSYNIYWYKQVPGGVPQFVLYFNRALSSPAYGTGFSSSHFTSRAQSNTHYQLVINSVEAEDSAVYYCKNCITVVFGQGTKLIVTDGSLAAPSLTLLPPSSEQLQADKAALVCLAQVSVGFAEVSWTYNGRPMADGVSTGAAKQQEDKSFALSSFLSVKPSDWDSDGVFSCKVSLGSKQSEATIKKSDCGV